MCEGVCSITNLHLAKDCVADFRRGLFRPVVSHVCTFELREPGVSFQEAAHIIIGSDRVFVSTISNGDRAHESLHAINNNINDACGGDVRKQHSNQTKQIY